MNMRGPLIYAGLFILGIILLAIGALIEPPRPQVSQSGESLIAIGLTFILWAVGFFLAWANPTA